MPTIFLAVENKYASAIVSNLHDLPHSTSTDDAKVHFRAVVNSLEPDRHTSRIDTAQIQRDFVDRGVEIVYGDRGEVASWGLMLQGVDVAVLATSVWDVNDGEEALREARREVEVFIEAAKKADVRHTILISSTNADLTLPGSRSHNQYLSEQLIRNSGLPWTIIRAPKFFIKSLVIPGFSELDSITSFKFMWGTGQWPWMAPEDFGTVVAKVLLDLEGYLEKILSVAMLMASIEEMSGIICRVEGRKPESVWQPLWWLDWTMQVPTARQKQVAAVRHLTKMRENISFAPMIEETNRLVQNSIGVEEWLRRQTQSKELKDVKS